MASEMSRPTLRISGVLLAVIVLNSLLLYRAFLEPESLISQTKQSEVSQPDKIAPISIEVVQEPTPQDVEKQTQSDQQSTPQNTLVAQQQTQEKSEDSEPRLVGQIDMGYFELERMVERTGGAIFLYDLNVKRPVRQIKRGVLVSLSQSPSSLSVVSHNLTDELEQHRVSSWAEEQRVFNPNGSFVVVAKFPANFQQGFEALAHQAAFELNIKYESVDEVRFRFTRQGLVINELAIDDRVLVVNKIFSA